MSNDRLGVTVVPELGGRIIEFSDLERGRQWAWRNHRVPLDRVGPDDDYDDVWQGGFEQFPFTWLFLSYGGWRDHQVAVLEPCTSYPKDLEQAVALGTAVDYVPGEVHRFSYELEVMAE